MSMSFRGYLLPFPMPPSPPPNPSSRGSSPARSDAEHGDQDQDLTAAIARCDAISATNKENSPFLRLPIDIFRCVVDYLNRDAAWALKRTCRGLSGSVVVDELLYRFPIQTIDVKDLRLNDWQYRRGGEDRWLLFQDSITDSNRNLVQKLAMPHWCSIEDFKWIQENLPNLKSLDISAIKDFAWTPQHTWSWKMVADACPTLFGRLEELEVANWADYTAHSRIEFSYSYNDYRFKQKFRISRRRDGGSVAKMIFPLCTRLKTLGIRERYTGFHSWNEFEVHQRVCCLVDGITNNCPSTLTKLRVHDFGPYRALLSAEVTDWSGLKDIEIGLFSWIEPRHERDILGPIPHRIMPGTQHRDEEVAFDDKTFDTCDRNHMRLGQSVVQNVGAAFEDVLHNLRTTMDNFPHINFRPIDAPGDRELHPFHLVNVAQRSRSLIRIPMPAIPPQVAPPQLIQTPAVPTAETDPLASQDIQNSLRWLAQKCNWKPVLAWESLMCDVFPANLESGRHLLPKTEVLARIQSMVETLRSLNIPIRLALGDRHNSMSSGLDGSLYFGDYKFHVGEGEEQQEILAPTQARFNLSGIAPLVDELTIQYPSDVPGVGGWGRPSKRRIQKERLLFQREMIGWRRFWKRYALQFTNLKKLTAIVPGDIFDDWGKCADLRMLFDDKRWSLLHVDEGPKLFVDPWQNGSHFRVNLTKSRSHIKFVRKVFFREDTKPLNISTPVESVEENEERLISDEDITKGFEHVNHRFWPTEAVDAGKRKAEDEGGREPVVKKSRNS